jgi:hypothetical protein
MSFPAVAAEQSGLPGGRQTDASEPSRKGTTMSLYQTSIEREIPLKISYTFHPYSKGARDCGRYLPIEPDEPAHIEIESIQAPDGTEVELTPAEHDRISEEIGEHEADKRIPDED